MKIPKNEMAPIKYTSANKIKEEPLKFKIKDEPTDNYSSNLTKCADETAETSSKDDGCGTVCKDSKVDTNYCSNLVENMDIVGREKHFKSTNIVKQEMPLKFEIKDELTDDNYSIEKDSEDHFIKKPNHSDVTVKGESVVFRDIFGMKDPKDEMAPINYNPANKINEEMFLKFEIKNEPTDYNSLNHTECVDDAIDPLYMDDDTEIYSQNSKIHSGRIPENNVAECLGKSAEDEKQMSVNETATEKKYPCDICNKGFINSFTLKIHKRIHTGEKPHQCDVCNKCFSQSSSLNVHKRTHTGERPYQCAVCDKNFSMKTHLIRHTRTHTGNKPYQCDVCNKCFSQSGILNLHRRTHTGEKPYQCDVCNKCFSLSSHLISHKRTHTGEKPYRCDVCNKRFGHLTNLNVHKRIHTGEKPNQCDVCNKSFNRLTNLNIHKRTHTVEKPYQCAVCNKRFSHLSSLNFHKRSHSDEKSS